jgi:hypothetical protein
VDLNKLPGRRRLSTVTQRHIEGMPHLDMGRAVGGISRALSGGLRADPSTGASESSFDRVHTSPQLVGAIVGAGRYWRLGGVPPGTDPPAACRI